LMQLPCLRCLCFAQPYGPALQSRWKILAERQAT